MESRLLNPLLNLFSEIEKILDFMEVKDLREAMKYETPDTRAWAEVWLGAMLETDTFVTYARFWTPVMFQEVVRNVDTFSIQKWIDKPHNTPMHFREHLLESGRREFFKVFEEKNTYYRMLMGLPPYRTNPADYVFLSPSLQAEYNAPENIPVHKLSSLIQNRYMLTEEYRNVLEQYPEKRYLKYMGIYRIDLLRARRAHDFEIIRYIPIDRSDVNPHLLKEFGNLYAEYRNYVMTTLYNKEMEGVYEGYRGFMKMLIQSFTLMQINNKAVEHVNDRRFLDDTVLHIILSKHGIPRSLLLTKDVRRNLVTNLLRITREKATDIVYDSLIEVLGYHDIIISKLLLMRGQKFDDDGQTHFSDGDELTSFDDMDKILNRDKNLDVEPHFIAVDIKDPNPYDTIINDRAKKFSIQEITDKDPRWWHFEDTIDLLNNKHYTVADSKYIMVEAVIHQMRYMFESIYFSRMIIDNRKYTDSFFINIPEIFGTDPVSLYDIMIFLIAANAVENGFNGEIIQRNEMLIVAGFNFDLDMDLFSEYLHTTQYVDIDRLLMFLENLSMRTPSDINRLFNEVISPLRDWLEMKISRSFNRIEFLEYEKIYRALFTYDGARPALIDKFKSPIEVIKERYGITDHEMLTFQFFYPHIRENGSLKAVTSDEELVKHYGVPVINPLGLFIRPNVRKIWYLNTTKGKIFLWDILNSPDLRFRYIDGERFPNTIFWDEETGTEIDEDFVNEVINMIMDIDELELSNAFFPITIEGPDRMAFQKGSVLPGIIRSEIFRNILADKVQMDMDGLADPAKTYQEYLRRINSPLYHLLPQNRAEPGDRESWMNDVMTIILALETELDMHMKYFEKSVVGADMFFQPLITLITHFKSTFVDFAKTGTRWLFADKMDAGGNSNMLKLFDYMRTFIHWLLLSRRGEAAEFGLYDTERRSRRRIRLEDRPTPTTHGSIKMIDEMKFFKNGEEVDPRSIPFYHNTQESGTMDYIIPMAEEFPVTTGTEIRIKFEYAVTTRARLNVGNHGAFHIQFNRLVIEDGDTVEFIFNGFFWETTSGVYNWPHHSSWYVGEPGSGRWEQDHDLVMRTRFDNANVYNVRVDLNKEEEEEETEEELYE